MSPSLQPLRRRFALLTATVLVVGCAGSGADVDDALDVRIDDVEASSETDAPTTDTDDDEQVDQSDADGGTDDDAPDDADEPAADEPAAADGDGDTSDQGGGSDPAPAGADEPELVGEGSCSLPLVGTGAPWSEQDYLDVIGAVNFEHEMVVMGMDEALTTLEEGIHDGPSLADSLDGLAGELTIAQHDLEGVVPPAGAEDWHLDVLTSWVEVCDRLEDGIAGAREGDMVRFEAFAESLREFPSLMNELHANTALGPFEAG
jgi:hypothetical protein